ncbi:hypothetical protein AGMMS50230_10760 [Spirochaetia bacterium]|nr:hypothetical protein AGMMS50230_10760 [Spirochaetia bacterium]
MKTIKAKTAVLLLFLAAAAGAQQFPSLDAAPAAGEHGRRVSGAAGSAEYWRDLSAAALWASSVNAGPGAEEKAAAYMDRINKAAAELAAADLPRDPKERGEYVLGFLHRRFLKSYSEYQTRLDEIFVSGRYNCVSSAVLYLILGRSAGLNVSGVMTKDHAFATVNTGTEIIDVETTNPYGFNPGNRKEFHDNFGKATGFAYVPVKNYRDRVQISEAELVSLILSNRIAIAERGNRFADTVPLAINRTVFLSSGPGISGGPGAGAVNISGANAADKAAFFEDPRRDMMNRIFNLGAYFIRTGKEDDALAWADYAAARFPDGERWQDFVNTAVNNKLVKLIRAKKIPDARYALTALKPKLSDSNYRTLDGLVLEAEAADKVNGIKNPGDAEAALAFLSRSWEFLHPQRREEMRTAAVLAEAERYGKVRNWQGGMDWLKTAMTRYGTNNKLEAALRTLRQNRVGELHNEFALLFNKKDYDGAKASVKRSLEEFPNERQLTQDLSMVERALQ